MITTSIKAKLTKSDDQINKHQQLWISNAFIIQHYSLKIGLDINITKIR